MLTSGKLLWDSRDSGLGYHHAKFAGDYTTNKGETEGSTLCPHPNSPAYPDRVKFVYFLHDFTFALMMMCNIYCMFLRTLNK